MSCPEQAVRLIESPAPQFLENSGDNDLRLHLHVRVNPSLLNPLPRASKHPKQSSAGAIHYRAGRVSEWDWQYLGPARRAMEALGLKSHLICLLISNKI